MERKLSKNRLRSGGICPETLLEMGNLKITLRGVVETIVDRVDNIPFLVVFFAVFYGGVAAATYFLTVCLGVDSGRWLFTFTAPLALFLLLFLGFAFLVHRLKEETEIPGEDLNFQEPYEEDSEEEPIM